MLVAARQLDSTWIHLVACNLRHLHRVVTGGTPAGDHLSAGSGGVRASLYEPPVSDKSAHGAGREMSEQIQNLKGADQRGLPGDHGQL